MAPEQNRGAQGDERSDQFSFCVTLYEALYRMHPFQGDSDDELLTNVLSAHVQRPPPHSLVPRWCRRVLATLRMAAAERSKQPNVMTVTRATQRAQQAQRRSDNGDRS